MNLPRPGFAVDMLQEARLATNRRMAFNNSRSKPTSPRCPMLLSPKKTFRHDKRRGNKEDRVHLGYAKAKKGFASSSDGVLAACLVASWMKRASSITSRSPRAHLWLGPHPWCSETPRIVIQSPRLVEMFVPSTTNNYGWGSASAALKPCKIHSVRTIIGLVKALLFLLPGVVHLQPDLAHRDWCCKELRFQDVSFCLCPRRGFRGGGG